MSNSRNNHQNKLGYRTNNHSTEITAINEETGLLNKGYTTLPSSQPNFLTFELPRDVIVSEEGFFKRMFPEMSKLDNTDFRKPRHPKK